MWCTTVLTLFTLGAFAGRLQAMSYYTWCLTIQVGEDLSALSVEFLFNLLLLTLTAVEV